MSQQQATTTHRGYASVKEAAEYLRVSERTVRRLVDTGKLEAGRVGGSERGRLVISYANLDRLAAGD